MFACLYECIPCIHGALVDQKGAAEPLELDLLMGMSHYVSAENQTWLFWKNSSFS